MNVLIGIDPIVGVPNSLMFPSGFREYLEDLDIMTLAHARNLLPDAHSYWYSVEDLGVGGEWKVAWDTFTRSLEICGMRLIDQMDALTWSYKNSNGSVSAKLIYDCILNASSPPSGSRLLTFVWNSNLPRKVCCFSWLVLMNRLLT